MCLGHVHERCAAEDTVGERKAARQDTHEVPCFNRATRNAGVKVGHGRPAHQGQVVRRIEQVNDRFKDGDVDGGRGHAARVVGPNGEHRARHVDCRRSRNDTVGEIQTSRQGGMDGPVLHRSTGVVGRERNHSNISGEGQVLWVVAQITGRLEHGEVDGMRYASSRVVGPYGEHRGRHVDRRCS